MSQPFLAEVRAFAFNFPPRGWAQCDGQILPINQNQSLYSLLGTTYGGDGRTTFGLPELRGRVPIHAGNGPGGRVQLGQRGGEENHFLNMNEMPLHSHSLFGTNNNATADSVNGNVFANSQPIAQNVYATPASLANMNAGSVGNQGANQGHNNMQPYLVINYCIALQGTFPSRN